MTHAQMFLKSKNDDGYISIICHRERYTEELKRLGWVESVDDLEQSGKKHDTSKNDSGRQPRNTKRG